MVGLRGPAVAVAAAPWLSRPWRRVAWATLLLIGVARLITGGLLPMQVVLALAAGVTVGAGPLVVFGVPDRRMGPAGVAAALRAGGVLVSRVNGPLVSAKGSRPFAAVAVFAGGLSRWAVDITVIDDAMTRRVASAPVPGFTAVARVIAEAGAAPATIIAGYVLLPALIVLRRFRYLDQNLAGQIPAIIGYVSRAALGQDLAERSGGRLRLN